VPLKPYTQKEYRAVMACDELVRGLAAYTQRVTSAGDVSAPSTLVLEAESETRPEQQRPAGASTSAWSRYASVENIGNLKQLQEVRRAVLAQLGDECEWIASEKVHGANFCFETDGRRVEYASRTSRLGNGADFFNARATMPKYHPFVLEAFRLAKERFPALESLLIYGEYFGGYYPGHPAEPGLKKVQGGVAYSPGHHFYAFDVCPDGGCYMDFDEARALLLAAGFPLVADALQRGPLDKLLTIDVEKLETSLPAQLGHPPLDRFRVAEGIVLRPAKEVVFGQHRAILKKKSKAFWEATNQPGMAGRAAQAAGGFAGFDSLLETVKSLSNENRLRAVISKDPSLLDVGQEHKLAGLFAKDILEDLQKQFEEQLAGLGKQASELKKSLQFLTRSVVQDRIAHIRQDIG